MPVHLEHPLGRVLDDAGARVVVLVDAVAKPIKRPWPALKFLDRRANIVVRAYLAQHAEDSFVRAAVQGTERRRYSRGH